MARLSRRGRAAAWRRAEWQACLRRIGARLWGTLWGGWQRARWAALWAHDLLLLGVAFRAWRALSPSLCRGLRGVSLLDPRLGGGRLHATRRRFLHLPALRTCGLAGAAPAFWHLARFHTALLVGCLRRWQDAVFVWHDRARVAHHLLARLPLPHPVCALVASFLGRVRLFSAPSPCPPLLHPPLPCPIPRVTPSRRDDAPPFSLLLAAPP